MSECRLGGLGLQQRQQFSQPLPNWKTARKSAPAQVVGSVFFSKIGRLREFSCNPWLFRLH